MCVAPLHLPSVCRRHLPCRMPSRTLSWGGADVAENSLQSASQEGPRSVSGAGRLQIRRLFAVFANAIRSDGYGRLVRSVWRKGPEGSAKGAVWHCQICRLARPPVPFGTAFAADWPCQRPPMPVCRAPSASPHRPRTARSPTASACRPSRSCPPQIPVFRNCHYKPPSRRSLCPAPLRAVRKLPWGAQQIAV